MEIMKPLIHRLFYYFGYKISKRQYFQADFECLLSLFFYEVPRDFFFIQIGSNDGKKNDPIYNFILKYKLTGLLVEPQKEVFKSLLQNYRGQDNLIYANVAISQKDGFQKMYSIKKSFQRVYNKQIRMSGGDATGIASFNKDHIRKTLKSNMSSFFKDKKIDDYIDKIEVETISFKTLLRRYNIKNINLLQIDTEGFDYEIIKMFDFEKYHPKLINYESRHLSDSERIKCEILLESKGYTLFKYKGDTCAIHCPPDFKRKDIGKKS